MPGAGPPGPAAWAAPVAETPPTGLTSTEVGERRARGLGAGAPERSSRSVGGILRANVLTRFNAILGALLAVILAVGQPQDALFGVVLIANALIGIGQELRAKLTLDRLAVLSAPQVQVVRDGEAREIAVADLVAGDWVDLRRGDQLVADGVVRASAGLEVDESLLTGESDPVGKGPGERLLSGSFVVAGSGGYQATEVGADAYARKLAAQARRFTLVRSELMEGINRILRYVTWAMVPVAALLLVSQVHARDSVAGGADRHGRRARRHGPAGARAAHQRRFRRGRGHPGPPPGAAAAASCRRGAGPGGCGLLRQDRHPDGRQHHVRPCHPARRRDRSGRGARRTGRRRGPERHAGRDRSGVPSASRVGAGLGRPVLLGSQVERRQLRRARDLGTRRS